MLNILVIDSNPHFVHALSYIIEDSFNDSIKNLLVAESGIDAISLLGENNDIDIVFLDVDMPNTNGIETTKEILNLKQSLNVIALSFHEGQGFKNRLLSAGAKQYVQKENITSGILQKIFDNIQ